MEISHRRSRHGTINRQLASERPDVSNRSVSLCTVISDVSRNEKRMSYRLVVSSLPLPLSLSSSLTCDSDLPAHCALYHKSRDAATKAYNMLLVIVTTYATDIKVFPEGSEYSTGLQGDNQSSFALFPHVASDTGL